MKRLLHVLVGILAICGGATLFATYFGEFNKHLQIQRNSVGALGFISEVTVAGGKSEIRYWFTESSATKKYTGSSVFDGTQYASFSAGMPTPIQYLDGNPEINRHQLARDHIYMFGRNIAIGVFLVLLGFAVIARGFGSSAPAMATEFVEIES